MSEWEGQTCQKFKGSIKVIPQNDQLKPGAVILGQSNETKQRKHFDEKLGQEYNYRPTMKQFEGLNSKQTHEIPSGQGIKKINFLPNPRPPVPEKKHIQGSQSKHLEDIPIGIKTFKGTGGLSQNQYNLEQVIGSKQRVRSLDAQRGGYPIKSLGDKIYKAVEYQSDFFKEGGLVPGQNIKAKKNKNNEKDLIFTRDKNKLTYQEKQKLEQKKLDQQDIKDLDIWVEKVLKEANPNYQDPETFFERMGDNASTTTANTKVDPKKDTKKATKK